MYYKSKYIIVDTGQCIAPVVFSELLTHSDVAQALANSSSVLGAGFCYIQDNRYVCYGSSISLGVKSRGEEDSKFLNKYLGAEHD